MAAGGGDQSRIQMQQPVEMKMKEGRDRAEEVNFVNIGEGV